MKASILALYHRIFVQIQFRRLVYFAAVFIFIQTVTVTYINVRQVLVLAVSPPF